MPIYLKRLAILVVAILVVAGVDGAIRGMRMPAQAGTELSQTTQELIAQARAERQGQRPPQEAAPKQAPRETTQAPPSEDPTDGLGMTTEDLHLAWEANLLHIVDARPPSQFQESHIPGAVSIPFEELSSGYPAALDILPLEGPIVVYCDGGDCHASRNVASLLIELGYENVSVFERGLEAWKLHGHPTESGTGTW